MLRVLALVWGVLLCVFAHAETPSHGGKPLLDVDPVRTRSLGYVSQGPSAAGLSTSTEVWTVTRRWYEVSDEAGLAWSANSGLTWDEKYAAWVDSLVQTTSEDGHVTVELTTPWGKTLPSPRLECAEMAMFLRVAFAAWHELPFYMRAYSPTHGTSIYSGHFGIVDGAGARISGTPSYRTAYTDHTSTLAGQDPSFIVANWPSDATLRTKSLTTAQDDDVGFLGADAYFGAYADEIFLNKRVGHFLLRLLTWHGSMHLASPHNAWNLAPEAIREGDVLLHRWQSSGIGHAMVVKEVTDLGGGQFDTEIIFGSMPRIQPKWYGPELSKSYFTNEKGGGPAIS